MDFHHASSQFMFTYKRKLSFPFESEEIHGMFKLGVSRSEELNLKSYLFEILKLIPWNVALIFARIVLKSNDNLFYKSTYFRFEFPTFICKNDFLFHFFILFQTIGIFKFLLFCLEVTSKVETKKSNHDVAFLCSVKIQNLVYISFIYQSFENYWFLKIV